MTSQPQPSKLSSWGAAPGSAIIILTIGILAVSTASIFIRAAQKDASSIVIAAYRLTLAVIILAPFSLRKTWLEFGPLETKAKVRLGLSGAFLALHFASWITSLEYTSVTSSVVLVTTTPLWVALFSPLILKERLGKETWAGLTLSILGGVVVGLQQSCTFSSQGLVCAPILDFSQMRGVLGNGLALFGAWMAAGYILVGRQVRPRLSLMPYTFIVYGVAAVLLIGFTAVMGQPLTGYSLNTYAIFGLLALVPQVLGHSSFNWALRYVPATFVSLALLGEPVGTTILAMLFLRETPAGGEILGGAMILAGIFWATGARGK